MRAIKKIVALATGATMLGATIMGAMAADLANYPAPFVTGCDFDGAIVVGDDAASSDVVGAVDISTTLAVSGTTTETSTGTATSATGESVKIDASANNVNIGEKLTMVKTVNIDDDDLPTILADGTFTNDEGEDFAYEQTLKFNKSAVLTFKSDNNYEKNTPIVMLYSNKKVQFMQYTLDFTKDAEADMNDAVAGALDDFEDSTLNILGKDYDITTAVSDSYVALTLMGGSVKDVMEQGQIKTYSLGGKDYEVEVTYIGGTTSAVKFKVNGELTDSMNAGQTKKLSDGTIIGVRELLEEEAGEVTADQVEFYLGAEKLYLKDADNSTGTDTTDNVQINDEDVDDLYVAIGASNDGTDVIIDKIVLTWRPDDEIFVTEDQEVTMPGLEAFKVSMGPMTKPAEEEISIGPSGDSSIELTIPLKTGTVTFDIASGNGTHWTSYGGDSDGENLTTSGAASIVFDTDTDQYFIASDSTAKETYLLEVTKINDNGASFKDVATGTTYDNKKNNTAFSIGGVTLTASNINAANDNLTITGSAGSFNTVYSAEGLTIYLPSDNATNAGKPMRNTSITLTVVEEDKDENIAAGNHSTVNIGFASLKASVISVLQTGLANNQYYELGDTDEFVGWINSTLATEVYYDTDPDQDEVKYIYHGAETYANIYVAEVDSRISASGSSGTAVCKVSVPAALLASEVASVSAQNLIVVGGPCANSASAEVMGVAGTVPECLAGFEEGKAMIKLYLYEGSTGKVAMLVAGMSAMDTRRASRVLKEYEDYSLSGDEVEVAGTSLTDISVSAPVVE